MIAGARAGDSHRAERASLYDALMPSPKAPLDLGRFQPARTDAIRSISFIRSIVLPSLLTLQLLLQLLLR